MSKIKFKLSNDEYEYDFQNTKNILPISDIPLNLIPKGPPKTGEIYLRMVHEEAKKCPKVVRKELPSSNEILITKETKNVNYLRQFFIKFEEETENEINNSKLIPTYLKASKEWKDNFIKDFKELRNQFNKNNLPNNYIKETFPSLEDESNWKVYLYGKSKRGLKKENLKFQNQNIKEVENNKEISTSNETLDSNVNNIINNHKRKLNEAIHINDTNDIVDSMELKKLKKENNTSINDLNMYITKMEGRVPELTIIKQMNQRIINKLIFYHSLWINDSISEKQFQWIYALLIGLDPLLTSSQVSILRDICKLCKTHREQLYKTLNENDSNKDINTDFEDTIKNNLIKKVAPLNIIITIITRFFSQSDLE